MSSGPTRESSAPANLVATASWDDAYHLNVTLRNAGGRDAILSDMTMSLSGPNGPMPIHWSGAAPMLRPGGVVQLDLHAMHMDDGTMGLAMDHAHGTHMPMPMGDYVLRVGEATASATLGG